MEKLNVTCDEVVFNQLRLGCVTLSSGYRWRPRAGDVSTCALCSQPDGPGHALLRCSKLSEGRGRLFTRVMCEREDLIRVKIEDDVRNGRLPPPLQNKPAAHHGDSHAAPGRCVGIHQKRAGVVRPIHAIARLILIRRHEFGKF